MSSLPPSAAAPSNVPPRRRSGFGVVIAILGAIAALVIGVPMIFCAIVAAKGAPTVERDSVITLRLDGAIPEGPSGNPFEKLGELNGNGPLSLHDMRQLAHYVKSDDKIKGVVLQIGPLATDYGTIEELSDYIQVMSSSGKPVEAFIMSDFVDEKTYLAALPASRIVANPEAGWAVNGLQAEVTFWRGSLDKLNVVPQFIMDEEYKSVAEPFINQKMSPAFREWLGSILNEYWARFMDSVVTHRKIQDKVALQALFDKGVFTASDAKKMGLVDDLGYYDEVIAHAAGKEPGNGELPHTITGQKYLLSKRNAPQSGDKIAVIYAVGPITSAFGGDGLFGGNEGISGPDMAEAIRDAGDDKDVKAILFRVNSPGGSAVGSDFIRREILRAKAKKPFVVSMGGVAGSGGYWISMDADEIVCQPSTITGSIGVVFGKFNLMGFYTDWLHANIDTMPAGGKNADILSFAHTDTPDQMATLKASIDSDYHDFVQNVANARHLSFDDAHAIAKGREWTGAQAKQRKLIDDLGGMEVAIDVVKKRANLTGDVQLVVYPKEKNFFEALSDALGGAQSAARKDADLQAAVERVKADITKPQIMLLAPTIEVN